MSTSPAGQLAGLFDVSHMGEVTVEGGDAERFIYHLVSNDVSKIAIGQAQYSILCQPDGGAVDDLMFTDVPKKNFNLCKCFKHRKGFCLDEADSRSGAICL